MNKIPVSRLKEGDQITIHLFKRFNSTVVDVEEKESCFCVTVVRKYLSKKQKEDKETRECKLWVPKKMKFDIAIEDE